MECVGLDFERFSRTVIRCHVHDARNAYLALVEKSRRGGQKGFAISPRIVRITVLYSIVIVYS